MQWGSVAELRGQLPTKWCFLYRINVRIYSESAYLRQSESDPESGWLPRFIGTSLSKNMSVVKFSWRSDHFSPEVWTEL